MRFFGTLVGITSFVLFVGTAIADDKNTKPNRDDDKELTDSLFVDRAFSSGMTEVAMGKLGQVRARHDEVKKFSNRLVEDHSKANMNLLSLVSDLRIAVPDKPLPEHEKHLMHFHGDGVKDFDKEFMEHMVKSHEAGVKLFTRASKELKNDQLKSFAEKTLPTLKEHLEMAKKINDQLAKGDKGNKGDRDRDRNRENK